jgi:DNA (cytosine-5)-methyltransferase 1
MNELSLYSGAGGGLLGTMLLGWNPIGYVEINEYCQQVISQRIADGLLPFAPIFSDVRKFIQSGAANEYRGVTDIVTGGFPCQPFSVAGKRKAGDDARNMWPATIEVIRIVRPKYCFLENVRGLLSSGYFGTILKDLAESGYDARWRVLSANEVGAPHKRDRLWIMAYTNSIRLKQCKENDQRLGEESEISSIDRTGSYSSSGFIRTDISEGEQYTAKDKYVADPIGKELEEWESISGDNGEEFQTPKRSHRDYRKPKWWELEPDIRRVVNGVASRLERIKSLGNGQVPFVAATAWRLLTEGLDD